jgi:hypothetical protein
MAYSIPVFLSYPKPHLQRQKGFVDAIINYLDKRGFAGRTLGVTDYGINAPLTAIRGLMVECNGIITIAFARTKVVDALAKPDSDLGQSSTVIKQQWLTSPWCHIEPAMAFQLGLPILLLREKGVIDDGILERGVTGTYLPEFDLDVPVEEYIESQEWKQLIGIWEGYVRRVVDSKSKPPQLF